MTDSTIIACGFLDSGTLIRNRESTSQERILLISKDSGVLEICGKECITAPYVYRIIHCRDQVSITLKKIFPIYWVHYTTQDSSCAYELDSFYTLPNASAAYEVCKVLVRSEDTEVRIAALNFLLSLCRTKEIDTSRKNRYMPELEQLRRDIYEYPWEDWKIPNMAEELNVSISHFHRLYRETFHKTAFKDVLESRVLYAKELLATTQDTAVRISQLVGFDNYSYFVQTFKRFTGLTTKEYRKRFTKDSNQIHEESDEDNDSICDCDTNEEKDIL